MVFCSVMRLQTVFLHHGQHMCWACMVHTPASCCPVKLLHSRTSSVLMAARQRAVLQLPALLLWLRPGTVLGEAAVASLAQVGVVLASAAACGLLSCRRCFWIADRSGLLSGVSCCMSSKALMSSIMAGNRRS